MRPEFVGVDPENPNDDCPAVFVDAETGGFLFQGETVIAPDVLVWFSASAALGDAESVVWLPARMAEIIREAVTGRFQPGQRRFEPGQHPRPDEDMRTRLERSSGRLAVADPMDSPSGTMGSVVQVDHETGDFFFRGRTVVDPNVLAWINSDSRIKDSESVVWLPADQAPIIMETLSGDFERGNRQPRTDEAVRPGLREAELRGADQRLPAIRRASGDA